MRVGMGYDVHKLVEGRDLIIGGVRIPHTLGLLGHSDADVLLHAIMDALLGAAGLGDIGKHFPDTDPQYKGISSMVGFPSVAEPDPGRGVTVENIDATIIAQKPKMPAIPAQMRKTSRSARHQHGSGQCQGDHGGGTWLHRNEEGISHRRSARFPVSREGSFTVADSAANAVLRRLRTNAQ